MDTALFMDLLGVRAKWISGGRTAAEEAFAGFRAVVNHGVRSVDPSCVLAGVIESDSAYICCDTLRTALEVGRQTYMRAFQPPAHSSRLWIRGVVMPGPGSSGLTRSAPLSGTYPQVIVVRYHGRLLDAIAAEKSGFRGMRLLVGRGRGVGQPQRGKVDPIHVGQYHLAPFLKVRAPAYPRALAGFRDFLWMATDDEEEHQVLMTHMFHRLRWASEDPEELAHAAATQVIFNHWDALRASWQKRPRHDV